MQQQPNLKAPLTPEVRAYFREIGRRGAAKHSLNQEARLLGVAVRRAKRAFVKKGFSEAAALEKARARLHLQGGRA